MLLRLIVLLLHHLQRVDEGHEVGRAAVERARREVQCRLVAPRAEERVLHDRQQLDVRETELARVLTERRRPRCRDKLSPRSSRRTNRGAPRRSRRRVEPLAFPRVRIQSSSCHSYARSATIERCRAAVGAKAKGRPCRRESGVRLDVELVPVTGVPAGESHRPQSAAAERLHGVGTGDPAVAIADHRHRARIRRPHAELDRVVDAVRAQRSYNR